jgi:C4-dicarboxylate-specific signal transduction histidine kinase
VALARSLPRVLGDRIQLQQVLLNLLLNGADAMSANAENDRQLEVVTETAETGDARVLIRDNGSGIEPGIDDSIFEPFVTTKPHGLGLGLSICRSIVTSHGGHLVGTNNLDRGATFALTLPAAARPPGAL